MRGTPGGTDNGVRTLPIQCSNCGFPNLEGVEACISCSEALPAVSISAEAPVAGDVVSPPAQSLAAPAEVSDGSGTVAAPVVAGVPPQRDPQASIEMFFPQRHGKLPTSAGANPEFAAEQSAGTGRVTSWGGVPASASATSDDPWSSAYDHPQTLGATVGSGYRPSVARINKPTQAERFATTDLVTVAGVLALLVSLVLPWATKIPTEEVRVVVTAGSFPLTFLLTGFQESYALAWLTAFVVLALCGVAAVIGTIISERPSSYMIVSSSGLVALFVSAAFLVKLVLLQAEVEAAQGGFSHGIGIYLAIGASLVILAGATLRSNRIKST